MSSFAFFSHPPSNQSSSFTLSFRIIHRANQIISQHQSVEGDLGRLDGGVDVLEVRAVQLTLLLPGAAGYLYITPPQLKKAPQLVCFEPVHHK